MNSIFRCSLDKLPRTDYLVLSVIGEEKSYRAVAFSEIYQLHIEGLNLLSINRDNQQLIPDARVSLMLALSNIQKSLIYVGRYGNHDLHDSYEELIKGMKNYHSKICQFELVGGEFYTEIKEPSDAPNCLMVDSNALISIDYEDLLYLIGRGSLAYSIDYNLDDVIRKYGKLTGENILNNLNDGLLFILCHDGTDAAAYSKDINLLNRLIQIIDKIANDFEKSEWFKKNRDRLIWSSFEQCLVLRNI